MLSFIVWSHGVFSHGDFVRWKDFLFFAKFKTTICCNNRHCYHFAPWQTESICRLEFFLIFLRSWENPGHRCIQFLTCHSLQALTFSSPFPYRCLLELLNWSKTTVISVSRKVKSLHKGCESSFYCQPVLFSKMPPTRWHHLGSPQYLQWRSQPVGKDQDHTTVVKNSTSTLLRKRSGPLGEWGEKSGLGSLTPTSVQAYGRFQPGTFFVSGQRTTFDLLSARSKTVISGLIILPI